MNEWWRKIPHPAYGNWGGLRRTDPDFCDDEIPAPFDKMDEAFMYHDIELREADHLEDEVARLVARKAGDRKLGRALRDPIHPFCYPSSGLGKFYGPVYQAGAKLIFRP
jgi:hypothetical protein